MNQVYGDNCCPQVFMWYERFKDGREDINEREKREKEKRYKVKRLPPTHRKGMYIKVISIVFLNINLHLLLQILIIGVMNFPKQ